MQLTKGTRVLAAIAESEPGAVWVVQAADATSAEIAREDGELACGEWDAIVVDASNLRLA